jgi:hypothetical protein
VHVRAVRSGNYGTCSALDLHQIYEGLGGQTLMGIGPQGPLRKDDGPACRVCGCTENNACLAELFHHQQCRSRRDGLCNCEAGRVGNVSCSWVKVEGASPPLCSACSGTVSDLAEALARGRRHLKQHGLDGFPFLLKINDAALTRYRARLKLST